MSILPLRVGVFALLLVCHSGAEEIGEPDFEIEDSYETLEKLADLREEPLDLNRASASELVVIPWISPLLAQEIIRWRGRPKAFASLDDLRSVPGMTDETLARVRPYLRVGDPRPAGRPLPLKFLFRSRLVDSRPTQEGYLGDSRKVYNRAKVGIGERLSLGLLAEKDSYERSYCDFLCGYLHVQDLGPFEEAVVGNYQLDLGEGLLFSRPKFTVKSSGIIKGSERGLEPYSSSDENSSLFGGAFQTNLGGFELIPFFSRTKLDATLDENGEVASPYESGYHRTENELGKVDKVTEELCGGRIGLRRSGRFKVGMTGYFSRYEPVFKHVEGGYYAFSGGSYSLLSLDFDVGLGPLELFGEYARSLGLGDGAVLASRIALRPVELLLVLRSYRDDFHSPHSAGFADGKDQNELGAFGGVNYRLSQSTKFRGYLDLYEHPRPAFRKAFPTWGREAFGEMEHRLVKDLTVRLRYRSKGRDESGAIENGSGLLFHRTENSRVQADWKESEKLSLRVRTELCKAAVPDLPSEERGGLLLVGVVSNPVDELRLEGRLVYFETDSYDSRIYEYENDLPGVMRNQALYGRGRRFYLLIQEKLSPSSKVSLKWGITSKEGEAAQTEYRLQLDLKA